MHWSSCLPCIIHEEHSLWKVSSKLVLRLDLQGGTKVDSLSPYYKACHFSSLEDSMNGEIVLLSSEILVN